VRFAWIPEHPRQPLYMAREPYRTGKIGEHLWLITSNACEALQFETKEACEAWIQANPYPMFVATEHGFIDLKKRPLQREKHKNRWGVRRNSAVISALRQPIILISAQT